MKYFKAYCFLLIGFCLLVGINCAEAVSSADLIENAKDYDGRNISFQGEVIGDIMRRGDFAWVNIADEYNAIGIWVPKDLADKITYAGDYKHIGDYIELTGTFHRACLLHNGELDIHVRELRILRQGQYKEEVTDSKKQNIALIFLGVTLCLGILRLLIKRLKNR